MERTGRSRWLAAPLALLLIGWAGFDLSADENGKARAELKNGKGETIGRAELTGTPNGVLILLRLSGAPPGVHAFHVHETGKCEAPAFKSAGGHFNPGQAEHGFLDAKGPHAGDLPNVHVGPDGTLTVEIVADGAALASGDAALLDSDGAALVLHFGADDYRTEPAGAAGDRVACGVIVQ